jgi:class 3 adenylate cyclase/tetratricopeptide (TPR) repeat protein
VGRGELIAVAAAAEVLASFLPERLLRRLASEPEGAGLPHADRMVGALLLADISGFTAITERLAARGPGGAEELRGLLDGAFKPLLELVAGTGGDVLKFAGDALLACWTAPPGDLAGRGLAAATGVAASCAEAMQAALGRYAAAQRLPLALRVGVGAGEVVVLDVGGARERRELLVAGEAVPQTTGAAGRARPGQVVLSRPARALAERAPGQHDPGQPDPGQPDPGVPDRADTRLRPPVGERSRPEGGVPAGVHSPRPEGGVPAGLHNRRPEGGIHNPRPEVPVGLVAPYLPRAMLASMVAGHEEWLAELRQITVLFANLPDLDHRAGLDEAQEVMAALQGALYRYEGSINKLSVDEKGTTLVAALGLPPLAHEDDPARGVRAAMAIREALAALGRRAAVGVTTGRAFCGTVGSRWRREYTMLGGVVNLAARLMQEAGDGVLCDAATARAARAGLAFEAIGPVRVKGRADPVPVYRPGRAAHGRAPEPVARTPLVGREEERERLAAAVARLTAGGGGQPGRTQVLVLEGEAGTGKSRLVAELVDQALAAGVSVLAGAGDAVERNTPWHPWRELFGGLPALDGADPAARRQVVLELLGPDPEVRDLAPLLNPVLGLELPETAASAQLTGQGRAGRTRDLLVGLVRAVVGETPTVVVIEDAHWLDSASTGLALALCRQRLPLLLVVATRPPHDTGTLTDELGWAAYRRLLRAPATERLVLDRLDSGAVRALVGQRLGVSSVSDALARLVEDKADGNPLFTEELTSSLREAELVRVVDGHVELASEVPDLLDRRMPHTVHGAITSRIDRLSPTQQLTVKVASVIGRVFAVVILREIHPLREAVARTLTADLSAIEQADLTVLESPEPDLHYLFKHVITQEAAYNLMLLSQRRQLHRSVAEWYERSGGGDLAVLAHHWRLAEVPEKALHYLERAGVDALREGAYAEAVRFFTALLEVDDTTAPAAGGRTRRAPRGGAAPTAKAIRRARWEHQLGDAYLGLGQLAPEQEHLHAALALLGRRTPASGRRLPGKLAWQTGQQLRNRLWPRPLVAGSPEARSALEEAAEVYDRLFQVDYHASHRARTVHQAVKGLNLAEAAGSRSAEARMAAACSVGAGLLGRHRLARSYVRRAFAALDGTDDPSARAGVLQTVALYEVGVGRWPEVREHLAEADGIVRRLGDPRRLAEITGLAVWDRYFRGELAAIGPLLAELDHIGRHSGDAQVRAWAVAGRTVVGLRTGDLAGAAAALRHRPAPAAQALLAALQGDRAMAVEALRRALAHAAQPPMKCYWFDLYAMSAEVALALWLDDRGRAGGGTGPWPAMAHQAVGYLGRYARVFPIGRPRALLHRGLADWTAGRVGPARRRWRAALAAAERLGMRYEQALALDVLGRHGEPARRPAHRERADALLGRLGLEGLASPEAVAARLAGR